MTPRNHTHPTDLRPVDGAIDLVMHLPIGTDAQIAAARRIIAAHAVDAVEARELAGMLGVAQ